MHTTNMAREVGVDVDFLCEAAYAMRCHRTSLPLTSARARVEGTVVTMPVATVKVRRGVLTTRVEISNIFQDMPDMSSVTTREVE